MPPSSLWTGRRDGDDHEWMAQQAPPPIRRSLRPPPPPPPPRRRRVWPWLLAALAGAAILGGGLVTADLLDGDDGVQVAEPLPADTGGRPQETRINQIYARVEAGVVSVQVNRSGGASSGTGFVIDDDGTLVTNAHVIGTADEARVRFTDDGRPVEAQVLGTDPSSDLAVLMVDPQDAPLKPLTIADSDQVKVGDEAIAIGYPLGLDRTATAGIVSGLGREIEAPNGFSIDEVIQTDAPINPGNSGGPLLDARGRVIGVNSQIASAGSGGNIGIGFAVPSNTVREVVPQLKAGRSVRRPWLGVSTSTSLVGGGGAVVRQVTPGGPAQAAGILPASSPDGSDGDRVVAIDGKEVNSPEDVAEAIEAKKPGDRVEVEVVRRGAERRTVEVELGVRPDQVP